MLILLLASCNDSFTKGTSNKFQLLDDEPCFFHLLMQSSELPSHHLTTMRKINFPLSITHLSLIKK